MQLKFTKSTLAKFAIIKDGKQEVAKILNIGDTTRENKLAAMFAAAPQMLKTLRTAKTVLEAGADVTELLQLIEAAIDKATRIHDKRVQNGAKN